MTKNHAPQFLSMNTIKNTIAVIWGEAFGKEVVWIAENEFDASKHKRVGDELEALPETIDEAKPVARKAAKK